jgi:hypothetical protein
MGPMIKIVNISNKVVGIVTVDSTGVHQTNLRVGEMMEVEQATPQIIQLCDPYKGILKIM